MKNLMIMRHAKSSWSDADLADIDRPLNLRGRLASTMMGVWISDIGPHPDHVLLSPARRVQETWERVERAATGLEPVVQTVDDIYMADPTRLIEAMRNLPGTCETCLLIGHQPGLGSLVRKLTGGDAPSACSRSFAKFPTAAIGILRADIDDWRDLRAGNLSYLTFACPKELV